MVFIYTSWSQIYHTVTLPYCTCKEMWKVITLQKFMTCSNFSGVYKFGISCFLSQNLFKIYFLSTFAGFSQSSYECTHEQTSQRCFAARFAVRQNVPQSDGKTLKRKVLAILFSVESRISNEEQSLQNSQVVYESAW